MNPTTATEQQEYINGYIGFYAFGQRPDPNFGSFPRTDGRYWRNLGMLDAQSGVASRVPGPLGFTTPSGAQYSVGDGKPPRLVSGSPSPPAAPGPAAPPPAAPGPAAPPPAAPGPAYRPAPPYTGPRDGRVIVAPPAPTPTPANPYGTPYGTPYGAPYGAPYGTPYGSPYGGGFYDPWGMSSRPVPPWMFGGSGIAFYGPWGQIVLTDPNSFQRGPVYY